MNREFKVLKRVRIHAGIRTPPGCATLPPDLLSGRPPRNGRLSILLRRHYARIRRYFQGEKQLALGHAKHFICYVINNRIKPVLDDL